MSEKLARLKELLGEVNDLTKSAAVLDWDQHTYLPRGGIPARAQQSATLARLAHEKFTSDEIGKLLAGLESETVGQPYEDDTVSLLRITRRDYDKARRLPPEFVAQVAHATGIAIPAWAQARAEKDWSRFEPHLQKMLDLKIQEAEYFGYSDRPYDSLLDSYEPGMKTAQVEAIFADVQKELVPLVRAIRERLDVVDAAVLHRHYDEDKQWTLATDAIKAIGYDFNDGRMDRVAHPFCTSFSNHDVRVTNRVQPDYFSTCFYGALHEAGHALYELGSPDAYERTPLAGGATLGIHESQSRLWENLVGRSRPFWQFYFPRFRKVFRKNASDVDPEKMYRAVNRVRPSFIRVEADEVTYTLHIILRFELENQLIEKKLRVQDLPDAWNAKLNDLLGITPPDVAMGALQDVHWSAGLFGYFATYSLGTFFSVQQFQAARRAIPELDDQFARGEFDGLLGWLRENIHRHGRKFTLNELAARVTGEPLETRSYMNYLRAKYGEIYGL